MPLILVNKPYRVLSQFTDAAGRATLADYVSVEGVYAAGRLDFDSEGLLALTDDGSLVQAIAHPRAKLDKAYWVQVEGTADNAAVAALTAGVVSRGERLTAASVELIDPPAVWPRHPPIRERKNVPDAWLGITLTEGRNRQVRRMTAAVGLPTLRLIRHRIGPFRLRALAPGETGELTNEFAWRQIKRYRRR